MGFQLRAAAKQDLVGIAHYSEREWGREQRNVYLKQLDDAFAQIANNIEIGLRCDLVRPGYRKFPTGSHIIYYRVGRDDSVEIVRILHKRTDVSRAISGT